MESQDTTRKRSPEHISHASESADSRISLLTRDIREWRCRRRIYFVSILGGYVALSIVGALTHYRWQATLFCLYMAGGVALAAILALNKRHLSAARILAQSDEPRVIGSLIEALEFGDTSVRTIVESSLVRLLPRLRPTDSGLLNGDHRAMLYRMLNMRNAQSKADLLVVILRSLPNIGDVIAVSKVNELVTAKVHTPNEKRVQDAAIRCLPSLREHVERERANSFFLRPVTTPDPSAETLLRPAHGTADPNPSLLLRASTPPEDEQKQSVTQGEAEEEPPR